MTKIEYAIIVAILALITVLVMWPPDPACESGVAMWMATRNAAFLKTTCP